MIRQRFESIDCANGIGIILVVFAHVIASHKVGWKIEEVITSFHMPLFFVLSGMFFSYKKNFKNFVVGKTNRLIVPFFFFFIIISVLLPLAFYCYKGNALNKLPSLLYGFISENLFIVGAIWFLLSLFFVSILFYIIKKSTKNRNEGVILISISLGILGYFLGKERIELPCWFDTTLTCMPYYAIGYLLKNKTKLLTAKIPDKYNFIFALLCIIIVTILSGHTCYRANHYNISIFNVFICGTLGFFAIFFLANSTVKSLSWLQYVGRNSIIILAIHQLIMMLITVSFRYINFNGWLAAMVNFAITMTLCCLLIPFMLKYMPRITGQKDLFKIHE